ncbi:hypothetical protein HK102_013597 [Quaeritorhiza haematococci]|nr:hypothetical protein HK102_013597 [Quaeritorhiza haematococci]
MFSLTSTRASALVLLLALLVATSSVNAVTLTYRMAPHERACFYTIAKEANEKIGFYFAIQSGGSFDIDYDVTGPNGELYLTGTKERQGDYVFPAKLPGEYSFCFSNVMSTFAEKLVDFDITAEHETKTESGSGSGQPHPIPSVEKEKEKTKEAVSPMEDSLLKIGGGLSNIQRLQKYFRTRENRNFSTVKSTESRIFWFALGGSFMMIMMAFLQVFVIQTFFTKSGKTRV